jgi:hypothetical protein
MALKPGTVLAFTQFGAFAGHGEHRRPGYPVRLRHRRHMLMRSGRISITLERRSVRPMSQSRFTRRTRWNLPRWHVRCSPCEPEVIEWQAHNKPRT